MRTADQTPINIGASEGIRTLDIYLGKVALYQTELRSLPFNNTANYGNLTQMQALFWQNCFNKSAIVTNLTFL